MEQQNRSLTEYEEAKIFFDKVRNFATEFSNTIPTDLIEDLEQQLDDNNDLVFRFGFRGAASDPELSKLQQAYAHKHFEHLGVQGDYFGWYKSWMDIWVSFAGGSALKNQALKQRYQCNPLNLPNEAIIWMVDWSQMGFTSQLYTELHDARKELGDIGWANLEKQNNYQAQILMVDKRFGRYGWYRFPKLRQSLSAHDAVLTIIGVH